jgi:hypothetical protein
VLGARAEMVQDQVQEFFKFSTFNCNFASFENVGSFRALPECLKMGK